MKSWFQNRRLRKQRSGQSLLHVGELTDKDEETALSAGRHGSIEVDEIMSPIYPSPTKSKQNGINPYAAADPSYRMSMERYLRAPMSDEPASAPAIQAAIKKRRTQEPKAHHETDAAQTLDSRDTSAGACSDGQRTFFTSGSVPDTIDTSYTMPINPDQHSRLQHDATTLTASTQMGLYTPKPNSPERPLTSGTIRAVVTTRNLVDQADRSMPLFSPKDNIDYRAKAEEEIAELQEKARNSERYMRFYEVERRSPEPAATPVTDEMAYARMAVHPKLVWVLGGNSSIINAVNKSASVGGPASVAGTLDEMPTRPRTASRADTPQDNRPNRGKSDKTPDGARTRKIGMESNPTTPVNQIRTTRPTFYCTFCEQRFHDRVGWIMHEQVVHLPEEIWICCPRIGEFPKKCPFCEKTKPSPSHLADHSYLFCQERSISERTFSRKDHFLQHISQVHGVRTPARLMELLEAWKHPLPLEEGHPALHCGFCGSIFVSYLERTRHVSQHFLEGLDMVSWWDDRISHNGDPQVQDRVVPNGNSPHKCVYCARTFDTISAAYQLHPTCSMWSCSFLPSMTHTIYLLGTHPNEAACCFCNDILNSGQGKVKSAVLKGHLVQHNYHKCDQRLYFSGQRFRQHLQDRHRVTFDGTLFAGWILLLKSSRIDKPAIFEQTSSSTARRTKSTADLSLEQASRTTRIEDVPSNFMDLTDIPQRAGPAKLRRKISAQTLPRQQSQQIRESTLFLAGPATLNSSLRPTPSLQLRRDSVSRTSVRPKSRGTIVSVAERVMSPCPIFYRKTVDASTRNRVYFYESDEPLSKTSQQLFRQIPHSVVGGLILHSSMIGAVAVHLTNSVDIYSLH